MIRIEIVDSGAFWSDEFSAGAANSVLPGQPVSNQPTKDRPEIHLSRPAVLSKEWGEVQLATLFPLLLISCALTDIASVKNTIIGEKRFARLLIIAPFADLRTQQDFENELSREFYFWKVDAFIGMDLIPPLREYSEAELNSIMNSYEIDGILVISSAEFFTSVSVIPPSATTTGSISVVGNYVKYKERTQMSGGLIEKPRVNIEIRLYDRITGEAAWMSSSLTRGNAFANTRTLASSLSRAVFRKLVDDGMLLKSRTRK